jgi:urate oxidase
MTDKDRLFQIYLKAKAEFERIAHSETIVSDDYEAARARAKAALKEYRDTRSPDR